MKNYLCLLLILSASFSGKAQTVNCTFKDPVVKIDFGAGGVQDLNIAVSDYDRVAGYCPRDGYYSYVPYTSDCFRGDWLTLEEDHTPGDVAGNMMLVNAAPRGGTFLTTGVDGLKGGTTYEFSVWMMNVCRPTDKCPFPLLPRITIQLFTAGGQTVAQMNTGELTRFNEPHWTQYRAMFTTPASAGALILTMADEAPGGCGNDFTLDDISFRECIPVKPVITPKPKIPPANTKPAIPKVVAPKPVTQAPPPKTETPTPKIPPVSTKPAVPKVETPKPVIKAPPPKTEASIPKTPPVVPKPETPKPVVPNKIVKKETPPPVRRPLQTTEVARPLADSPARPAIVRQPPPVMPAPPSVLINRTTQLIRQVEAEAGEIRVSLYDNGTVDGDTVTVYDNNVLLVAHARLSEKPITFHIGIDAAHPRHELVMVADNLGSIPPNTSLMVVTAGTARYEIYISSNEQKNAKVIFELKKE